MDIVATLQENQELVLLVSTGLIGIVIGFLLGRSGDSTKVDEAVKKAKEEAEEEKMEISRDLNNELLKVRDSIVQTVNAYSAVAQTMQEKLPIPPELQAIEGEFKSPIQLELDSGSSPSEKEASDELLSVEEELEVDDSEEVVREKELNGEHAVEASSEDFQLSDSDVSDSDEEPLSPNSDGETFTELTEDDPEDDESKVSEPVRINA